MHQSNIVRTKTIAPIESEIVFDDEVTGIIAKSANLTLKPQTEQSDLKDEYAATIGWVQDKLDSSPSSTVAGKEVSILAENTLTSQYKTSITHYKDVPGLETRESACSHEVSNKPDGSWIVSIIQLPTQFSMINLECTSKYFCVTVQTMGAKFTSSGQVSRMLLIPVDEEEVPLAKVTLEKVDDSIRILVTGENLDKYMENQSTYTIVKIRIHPTEK